MPQPHLKSKIYSIYKPSLGLIKNEPTSILNPRASIDCQNVRYYNGIVEKRTGYVDYGTGTITGIPIKFYGYQQINGQKREILATTTNIYNNDEGVWTSIASSIGCNIDDRISINTMYIADTFYAVWGSKNYLAKKWDGTSVTALASDVSTWKPKVIVPYQYRLLMFNIDVGGTNKPIRMSYCAANDMDDWTGTGSASRNLIQGMGSEILNAIQIKNYLGVYKDLSITLLSYVGGDSIFATQVPVDGIGLLAQDAIVNLKTKHLFLGSDYNIYQWEGGAELITIGTSVKDYIEENINRSQFSRCFAIPNYENKEAHFFIPTGTSDYPNVFLTYNWADKTWAINTIDKMSGGGNIRTGSVEKTLIANGISNWSTGGEYECSVEPDDSSLGIEKWTLYDTDYSSVSAGILTIDTSAATSRKTAYLRSPAINFNAGFTVKFKAQVVSSAGNYPFYINLHDEINLLHCQVYFRSDSIYRHNGDKICDFDTTDAYHVYRLYIIGSTATLYIDDVDKGSWTVGIAYGGSIIAFGDSETDSSINIKIDYLYYGASDLDTPTGNSTVFKYDYSSANDDGDAISAYFTTPDIVLSGEEHEVLQKNITRVVVEAIGSALICEYSTDSGENWSDTDTQSLDSTTYYDIYSFFVSKTTRKIRFRFSSIAADASWAIRYIGIEYKERERK